MVPTFETLNRYVTHERRQYQERVRAAARGVLLHRTLPVVDKAGVLYHHFTMDPVFGAGNPVQPWVKTWGGEPTTVILKCILGIAQPCVQETFNIPGGQQAVVGVDEQIRSKVMELVRLWSRADPVVAQNPPPVPASGDAPPSGGSGKGAPGTRPWKRKALDDGGSDRALRPRIEDPVGGGAKVQAKVIKWLEGLPA